MKDPIDKATREGAKAMREGKKFEVDCPYPHHTPEGQAWADGWNRQANLYIEEGLDPYPNQEINHG